MGAFFMAYNTGYTFKFLFPSARKYYKLNLFLPA